MPSTLFLGMRTAAAIEAAADAMAPLLDWSPARKAAEIEACRAIRASSLEPLAAPMSRAAAS